MAVGHQKLHHARKGHWYEISTSLAWQHPKSNRNRTFYERSGDKIIRGEKTSGEYNSEESILRMRRTNLDHSSWPRPRNSTPLWIKPRLNATKEICLANCRLFRGDSRNKIKSSNISPNKVQALWPSCRRNSNMIYEPAGFFHNLEPSMHDFGSRNGMIQARKRRQWRFKTLADMILK